jgi:hypothetical protein
MSILEGGEYKCFIHGFNTEDSEEWYKHCEAKDKDGNPSHMQEGTSACIFCQEPNIKYNVPYARPGTPKAAICDNCKSSQLGSVAK